MKPEIEIETTKDDLVAKGYIALTPKVLLKLISNTTVSGDYEYSGHRRYKTFMNANGEMEAQNDWGTYEEGKWKVDENGYFTVEWDGYWEDWTGVAFQVDNELKFYDLKSGKWRTSFDSIVKGKHPLEV